MTRSVSGGLVPMLCLLAAGAAQAQVSAAGIGTVTASERPYTAQQAPTMQQTVTYGLCSLPQNADALPTQPVPVQEDSCYDYQAYEANSATPSTGGSCGGFTVAFGAMGDLKTNWKRYRLNATWGDTQLTQAQCTQARLAAVAWGARCENEACSSATWEKIGTPASKAGAWSANQNRCFLELQFSNGTQRYKTLNIDIIASLQTGSQTVRKRAHGAIRAEKGNGKCASTTQQAPTPQVQAASTAGASVRRP